MRLEEKTIMLSIFYMDNYLKINRNLDIQILYIFTVICLHIAIKVNDSNHLFSYEDA